MKDTDLPPRALSIKPSWAWAVLYCGKRIENRSWWTAWRGPLFLHASAQEKQAEYEEAKAFAIRVATPGSYVHQYPFPERDAVMHQLAGRFFAIARLDGCVLPFGLIEDPAGDPSSLRSRWLATWGRVAPIRAAADLAEIEERGREHVSACDPWLFPGHYGYVLKDVTALRNRVAWKGHQGLWTVPDEARKLVAKAAA